MAQNLQEKDQSTNSRSAKAADSQGPLSFSSTEDDFIDINHTDIDMPDHDKDDEKVHSSPLDLHRYGNNIRDVDDIGDGEDDSDDDDHDPMANHSLLNMLTGRLGGRRRGSTHKWDRLHPENQTLSVFDVDQCTKVEEEAFPPEERASREKFLYRLTRCPELSLGLFTQPTKAEAEESNTPPQRRLMAHVVSTRTPAPSVTEASMGIPSNWKTRRSSLPSSDDDEEPLGHQEQGGTICIHSVAVAPEFQKMGLGSILMKSYIARIKDSKSAKQLALLAHDHLVPFYKGLGFENLGPSAVTSHGGNWNNMVLEFTYDDEE